MYNPLLDTFIITAACGSFTKAAEQLFITPAAVMHQINTLEEHLGITLFKRSNHGLQLTAAGESILKDSKKVIRDSQKIIDRAQAKEEEQNKTILIGTSFLNPCHVFLVWRKNNISQPDPYIFKMVPFSDEKDQILSVVKRLGEDIDILAGNFNSPQMHQYADYLKLWENTLCVAVPAQNELADKKFLEVSDLYQQKLIIPMQEKSGPFIAFLNDHPQIQTESAGYFYDLNTFNYCQESSSLLLTSEIWKDIHPSLITLPVHWDLTVSYGLLYSKNPSFKVRQFLSSLIHE